MQKIRWKKNLLGYLLWLLFCSMVCCIFVITGTEMLAGVGVEKAGISIAVLCIFAVAEIHIFFRIYGVGEGKEQNRQKEQAGIILAILLLVILRILAASRWGLEPVDRAFFEMAEVTTGQQFLPLIAHKASYIYLCWLSALFRFFGNRWEVAVVMQLLMQTGASLLFYLSVRKLMGRTAAFWFLVLSAISPAFLVHYREISPDWLLCMLLGVVLLMAALLYSETKKGNFGRIVSLGIFVGILTGTYAWLDLWGNVVLLAILVGILQLDREDCRGEKGAAAFCLLVGFFGAFAALFGIEGSVTGIGYPALWQQYISLYLDKIQLTVWEPLYGFELIGLFLISMLAGMAVIGFFRQKYEKTAVITVLLLGNLVFRAINMTQTSYRNLGNFLFLLAACTGIQCLADSCENRKESQGICPGGDWTDVREEKEESGGREEEMKESEREKQEVTNTEDGNSEQEIKYIPNPLPVPKRHVKKEIAFDYEPEMSQMKFDRELRPGEDDFDI
ncbi:MAG: hypothetical protein HFI94_04975 [Lachnospiraceae bacterium]|nr:hypothetical protein [Lachnospiraceae bacterium]